MHPTHFAVPPRYLARSHNLNRATLSITRLALPAAVGPDGIARPHNTIPHAAQWTAQTARDYDAKM